MSSARRQNTTPIIVEVRPNNTNPKQPIGLAPATPPSPKAVRFASAEPVSGVSRPLNPAEAWSLYHFEAHARQCPDCIDPYSVYLNGRRLCSTGHALAADVACHVCHRDGEVYSTKKDSHKYVRVEIPYGYEQIRGLLRSLDRGVRQRERTMPIISYDRTYPVSPRRREPEPRREPEDRAEVIVEPARTPRKHESTRYKYDVQTPAATVDEDSQASRTKRKEPEQRSKRGSLYDKDMQRPRKEYRVEVREPVDAEQRRRRRERDSAREGEKKGEDRDREERRRRKEERR